MLWCETNLFLDMTNQYMDIVNNNAKHVFNAEIYDCDNGYAHIF